MSKSLHYALEQQLSREISLMREILSFIHQVEYALLSGDTEMQAQLEVFASETALQMNTVRQKRIELTAKILKWPAQEATDSSGFTEKLSSASKALFEQTELLELKIEDQQKRNDLLSQAIDTHKEIPQATSDSPILIQPVYSKNQKKPIMLTIDFFDDPSEQD